MQVFSDSVCSVLSVNHGGESVLLFYVEFLLKGGVLWGCPSYSRENMQRNPKTKEMAERKLLSPAGVLHSLPGLRRPCSGS